MTIILYRLASVHHARITGPRNMTQNFLFTPLANTVEETRGKRANGCRKLACNDDEDEEGADEKCEDAARESVVESGYDTLHEWMNQRALSAFQHPRAPRTQTTASAPPTPPPRPRPRRWSQTGLKPYNLTDLTGTVRLLRVHRIKLHTFAIASFR